MMLPEWFDSNVTYYIVVGIIGTILLAVEIWELILIKKQDKLNETLQRQLGQQCKECQQPCINQIYFDDRSPICQPNHSRNNEVAHDDVGT